MHRHRWRALAGDQDAASAQLANVWQQNHDFFKSSILTREPVHVFPTSKRTRPLDSLQGHNERTGREKNSTDMYTSHPNPQFVSAPRSRLREAANRSAAQADADQRFAEATTTTFPAAKGTCP
jgi:hypothetical protein